MAMMAQTHVEGVEYYKADQIENAKTLLQRNLNNAGTDKAVSYYYLGQIDLLDNNLNAAAKNFELGAQADPENPFNYIGLGSIELRKGDYKVANNQFSAAEKRAKKDASVYVDIARAYYDVDPVKYAKEIEKKMEKARKVNIACPDIYIFEGDQAADAQNYNSAGTKYDMAIGYDTKATGAYVKYAKLFKKVNPSYSVQMLKKLLADNPNSALGQRELANIYYDLNQFDDAAKQYGAYVKNPNHFKEDEDRYAFLLFYDGQYQQGYDYATQLLKANPNNFTARRFQFMNAAQIPAMKEQLLPMAEALQAAHNKDAAKNKYAAVDYNLLSHVYQQAGKTAEAEAVLQEGMKAMPDNANFIKSLAQLYLNSDNYVKCADTFAKYVAKVGDAGYNDLVQLALYDYVAGIQCQQNKSEDAAKYFDEAIKNAQKAIEEAPEQYKPKKIIGDVMAAKNAANPAEASKAASPFYEEAIGLLEASADPSKYATDAKNMYKALGYYFLDAKDKAKAKSYFQKYMTLDPNNAEMAKFVNTL